MTPWEEQDAERKERFEHMFERTVRSTPTGQVVYAKYVEAKRRNRRVTLREITNDDEFEFIRFIFNETKKELEGQ